MGLESVSASEDVIGDLPSPCFHQFIIIGGNTGRREKRYTSRMHKDHRRRREAICAAVTNKAGSL